MSHVIKHLRKQKIESIVDDLDSDSTDDYEREADLLANEALISVNQWETALARYLRTYESVLDLAGKLGISPAIIAGRIRFEANNYTILNCLIGQGEVRKLFPEANFGN
jgi:HTH-type transcriptional regulator/antitoxin HigA